MKLYLGIFFAVVSFAGAVQINNVQQLKDAIQRGETHVIVGDIHVPAGTTLDFRGLKPGSHIEFAGRVTFGYKEWTGHLIIIAGSNLRVTGNKGHSIDGQGQRWWDSCGGNCGKDKPFLIYFQLRDSEVKRLHIKNSPAWVVAINDCHNVHFSKININNALGHHRGAHNTDGFDIAKSSNIRIYDSQVNNQDDCLAINSGTDIVFENNICEGGHGIAVAVGGYDVNEASNILIRNCKVIKNNIGIRVKTHLHSQGIVRGVTFDNIELQDISDVGIMVIGNYLNRGPEGNATAGIPIIDLNINNVYGNVLANGSNHYINVANGAAQNWIWNSRVHGGKKYPGFRGKCEGVPTNIGNVCS